MQFNQTVRNTGEFGTDTYDLTVSFALADDPVPGGRQHAADRHRRRRHARHRPGRPGQLEDDCREDGAPGRRVGRRQQRGPGHGDLIAEPDQDENRALPDRRAGDSSRKPTRNPAGPRSASTAPTSRRRARRRTRTAMSPAVATAPDGRIVQVWYQGRSIGNNRYVYELYYAVLDNRGNVIRPAARITDLSAASTSAYDYDPAVAVAPDGRVGIAWRRDLWNSSNSTYNYNIYFMVLAANGATVKPATNLTNNGSWGTSERHRTCPGSTIRPSRRPLDGRFGLAWERQVYDGSSWSRRRRGTPCAAATAARSRPLRSSRANTRSYYPEPDVPGRRHPVPGAADGQPMLGYGRIDSSGNVVTGLTTLAASYPYVPGRDPTPQRQHRARLDQRERRLCRAERRAGDRQGRDLAAQHLADGRRLRLGDPERQPGRAHLGRRLLRVPAQPVLRAAGRRAATSLPGR